MLLLLAQSAVKQHQEQRAAVGEFQRAEADLAIVFDAEQLGVRILAGETGDADIDEAIAGAAIA